MARRTAALLNPTTQTRLGPPPAPAEIDLRLATGADGVNVSWRMIVGEDHEPQPTGRDETVGIQITQQDGLFKAEFGHRLSSPEGAKAPSL